MIKKFDKGALVARVKELALVFKNDTNKDTVVESYTNMQTELDNLNVGLDKIGLKEKDRIEICGKRQRLQKELKLKVQPCKEETKNETVEILQEA